MTSTKLVFSIQPAEKLLADTVPSVPLIDEQLINLNYVATKFVAPKENQYRVANQLRLLLKHNNRSFLWMTFKLSEGKNNVWMHGKFARIICVQLIDKSPNRF